MTVDVIDMNALKRLLDVIGGDPEDLQDLIDEFESTTPEILQEIQTAGANADWSALRISTHSLKSSCRDFGAIELAKLCEELEHQCRSEAVVDADAQITQISSALTAARQALSAVQVADV